MAESTVNVSIVQAVPETGGVPLTVTVTLLEHEPLVPLPKSVYVTVPLIAPVSMLPLLATN